MYGRSKTAGYHTRARMKTRVLIADDQRLFAEGIKTLIKTRTGDIEVVGIARDGEEAVELARSERPDVILMDVCMPKVDGVEAVRRIRKEQPDIAILVLTTFDDDEYVLEALRSGAIGYLLKDMPIEDLIATIQGIRAGAVVMAPSVANNLVRSLQQTMAGPKRQTAADVPPRWVDSLSPRERQILALIAQGCNNYDIGSRLAIGEQTVKNYVSSIYDKLSLHDRIQVMREASRYLRFLVED